MTVVEVNRDSALRACELRDLVNWMDAQPLSLSSVECFRKGVLEIADKLARPHGLRLISDRQFSMRVEQ